MRGAILFASALCAAVLAGCATPAAGTPAAGTPAAATPAGEPLFHYVRSNRDGSAPEHIVHFRPARTEVAVYKWVERCTTAAYVTATMDPAQWEAVHLDAGKVGRDGSQEKFGRLDLDPATRTLTASLDTPGGPLKDRLAVPDRPWRLFDYDLADLNAAFQEQRPTADFSFGLALVWPEEGDGKLFVYAGRVDARVAGEEVHLGRRSRRFDLTLDGPTPATGHLWIDAARSFIVAAELGLPNHPGYRDFRLVLERVETGGAEAWDALLKRHYAGCPTGN